MKGEFVWPKKMNQFVKFLIDKVSLCFKIRTRAGIFSRQQIGFNLLNPIYDLKKLGHK